MKLSILGFYLRHEVRTGGHKRYLELLDSLSKKGLDVTVILSNTINTSNYNFRSITVKPVYKGKLVPYSIKQVFRILYTVFKLPNKKWVTIAFGETNYLSLKLVKMLKKSKILFAFRSNTYRAKDNEYKYYNKSKSLKNRVVLAKMLLLEKKINKISDLIVFQTEIDRDDILNRTKTDISKSVIIPNSIRESWFDLSFRGINTSKSLKKVIYLGNYDIRKGAMFLLKAFNILMNKNLDLELHLYGGGNERVLLNEYVTKKEMTDKVTVHGKMDNPISKISDFDLMVIPSIYDSYPNVILESLFTGTPVLGSDNSGMKSILEYDELLFKTADPEDLANKIEVLFKDNNQYKKIHDLCKLRAEFHDFSWPSKFEESILKLFK